MPSVAWYKALNGSTKETTISGESWFRIPGTASRHSIHVKRHCGGLLALQITEGGLVEITETDLRQVLRDTGLTLPWEART